jgi:hypothetical protein
MYFRASRLAGLAHRLQGLNTGFSASSADIIFIADYAHPACARGIFNA